MHACVHVSLCVHLSVYSGGGEGLHAYGGGGGVCIQYLCLQGCGGGGVFLPVSVNTQEHVTQPNTSWSKRYVSYYKETGGNSKEEGEYDQEDDEEKDEEDEDGKDDEEGRGRRT